MPLNEGAKQLSLDDLWLTVWSRKPGDDEVLPGLPGSGRAVRMVPTVAEDRKTDQASRTTGPLSLARNRTPVIALAWSDPCQGLSSTQA